MSIPITITNRLIEALKATHNIVNLTNAIDIARSHGMNYNDIYKIAKTLGIDPTQFDELMERCDDYDSRGEDEDNE